MRYEEFTIEGRNAVIEAFRSGKTIDKLFVLDGCHDGPVNTITREARKGDTIINYVSKERLDSMSKTGKHQGVIAYAAAYEYAEVDDILEAAREKGEPPFIFILDNIEDPHNLGAIIRTANLAGAHGVIIPKRHAVGLHCADAPCECRNTSGAVSAQLRLSSVRIIERHAEIRLFRIADENHPFASDSGMVGRHRRDEAAPLREFLIPVVNQHKVVSGPVHLCKTYLPHF